MNLTLTTIPIVFALIMAVAYTGVGLFITRRPPFLIVNAVATFLVYWGTTAFYIWAFMPSMVGAWGGWKFLIGAWFLGAIPYAIVMLIVTWIVAGSPIAAFDDGDSYSYSSSSRRNKRKSSGEKKLWSVYLSNIVLGFVAFCLVWGGLLDGISGAVNVWGDSHMQEYVRAAHITTAGKQMPSSDPTHIVLVTQDIAAYLGQQVLSTTGQNLGSRFHFEHDQYTLQSVTVHGRPTLFWIAPLDYNNIQQQANSFDTPGYVMVNAEDPNAQPILVEKDLQGKSVQFHYIPGLFGDRDLMRHVYQQGYNECNLQDPTVEVDNNLRPWYTILCSEPLNGYEGTQPKLVLLADPTTGRVVSYQPGKQPSWVDRVIPQEDAEHYVDWWGRYQHASFIDGGNHANEQVRAGDTEILYNFTGGSDLPVYMMAITSNSDNDTSSNGFVLYDTNTLKGTFYPLTGLTVGDPVMNVFDKFDQNLKNYPVSGIRLYNLYGVPTWVAIYEQPNSQGATFEAVGMVDATNLSGNNVVWGKTLDEALSNYQAQLATQGNNQQNGTSNATGKTLTGVIERLVAQTNQGTTTYTMIISGSPHLFVVGSTLAEAKYLNVAQVGDTVTIQYNDTTQQTATVLSFEDVTVEKLISAPVVPSPSPTPTH